MTTSVLLADDQPVVRSGLRMILECHGDLTVVGEAATGAEAIELTHALDPDVVLMDISMPDTDGIEATRQLSRDGARASVLVLTTYDSENHIYDALEAGASGFLLKTDPPQAIVAGVRTVARGDALLSPGITRRLIADALSGRAPTPSSPGLDKLTERERDVLDQLARGLSNAEIARELFIGEGTVKTHVARLLDKLHLRDRVQAVVYAHRNGLA